MANCEEKAIEWGISVRAVNKLCKDGKIEGAIKDKNKWIIPDDASKPTDNRVVSGKYIKSEEERERKPLPIGVSDYIRAQSEYYYVDKTLLIRDFIDRKELVSLFTRPRRFGKTMNMDMLRVFFELSDEDTSKYFKDKEIWKCGKKYQEHQGKYPVIFLTFKDVKYDSWEKTLKKISELIQEEFGRHSELKYSDKLEQYEKEYFNKVLEGKADEVDLSSSLKKLSKMLDTHYHKAPVIIIDEYDTPIQEGYSKEFYNEIVGFMRNFFSGAFKDNQHLSYGFLTGILRIAQESIFSGMNNLAVNTIMDKEYDSFFGFTENEIKKMLSYYGYADKEAELKEWYDGYIFGEKEIFNPWSVISYLSKECLPQAYWVNTGKSEILEDVLESANSDVSKKLFELLQGNNVVVKIDQNVIYRSVLEDPANVYSVLLVAGYLKPIKKELRDDGTWFCEVAIPNREITSVYKKEILSHLMQSGIIEKTTADKIAMSLYSQDLDELKEGISEYMSKSISFYDSGAEGFYHGLTLGLIAMMDTGYTIKSNRESGDGRYDISLFPKDKKSPGIIIELKSDKNLTDKALDSLAKEALAQIDKKKYDAEMLEAGITKILKLGMAFSGKKLSISNA